MKKFTLTMTALMLIASQTTAQVMLPYQNPELSFHDRAVDLVSRLSLEEKCSQLGNNVPEVINRADYQDATAMVKLPAYQYWNEALHGVARSGAATSFPESKGMSASWDRQLIFDCANATSTEARVYNNLYSKGLNYWCPTINMSRDPRWGRDEENYGEDPFLAGTLAVQYIKGMQGEQTADNPYLKTVACAKHFAANNYEQGRQGSTSFMKEHVLREYYLPAFQMAVKEGGVKSIMSSYNALSTDLNEKNAAGIGWTAKKSRGGKPNAMNDWLLTNILRHEWGFDGYVTSDCAGVSCIYRNSKHCYYGENADGSELQQQYMARATGDAIKAGNDLNCEFKNTTAVFQTAAQQAIEDGWMTEADLDKALIRVLETRFALGEFDDNCPWRQVADSQLECAEHQALALKAAQESIVLLKNEKAQETDDAPLLPLSTTKSIALIGPYANAIMLGDYSGTPTYTTTPFEAVAKKMNFDISSINDGTIQAENFDEAVVSKRGASKNNQGGGCLENTAPDDIFLYKNITFVEGTTNFEMACGAKNTGVGQVSFMLDSKDATPFLTVDNKDTGGWTKWVTITATLDPAIVNGTHDLYVKFSGEQKYVGNYDYFRFYNPNYNPMEEVGPVYMLTTTNAVNEVAADNMIARAKAVAQKADVVVFLGGTDFSKPDNHATGTESHDRWQLTLPGNQEEVLKAIYEVNKNVVLALESNSSLDITWAKENIPAILDAWYGGQAQGQAICDVLYGDYNPGGKLTTTWYNSLSELPAASDSKFSANGMLEYDIDDWGYTYMYYGKGTGANVARQAEKPMYPFGYGLSYTTFEYSNLAPATAALQFGDEVAVSFDVKNTGNQKGAEVVQLYVSFPGSTVHHNINRKLVGFDRVELEPGETQTVTIPLKYEQLSYYDDETHNFKVEGGTVNFYVSASSADDRLSGTINTTAATVEDTYLSDPSIITAIQHTPVVNKTNGQQVYNLQGTCVGTKDNLQSLPKGLYIIGDQKLVR